MWRWNPAPIWSASCSLRRARAISRSRPRATLGERVKGRAGKVALTVDADDATLAAVVEALKPDMLQLHGNETPERVTALRARFGLPVMKAMPIAERKDLARIELYKKVADRLIFDARAPRDATRPGGLGTPFDWTLLKGIDPGIPFMLSGGLDRRQCRRSLAHHARAGRRCLLGRRARARRKGPRQDPRLHPRRARGRGRARRRRSDCMTAPQPNSFRTGPDERGHFGIYGGRFVAETLMPLILELEKAYAHGQGRSEIPEGDGRLSRDLCRPAVAALFRRAAHRSTAAAPKSISSARSSTTPARTR